MNQIGFNVLRRAQDNAKELAKLSAFFNERGVELKEVKLDPDKYSEMIKQYSKACVNESLFEESRERLQLEFNKICEYHQRNEEELTKEFAQIAKEIILTATID